MVGKCKRGEQKRAQLVLDHDHDHGHGHGDDVGHDDDGGGGDGVDDKVIVTTMKMMMRFASNVDWEQIKTLGLQVLPFLNNSKVVKEAADETRLKSAQARTLM